MTPGKRTLAAAGLLAALALAGCGGYSPNGNPTNTSGQQGVPAANESAGPQPSTEPAAAGNNDVTPAGIPTDKLTGKSIPKMGKVVVDAKGWILYRFDKDTANPPASNCSGKCAAIWPPVLTDGTPTLTGVDSKLVGTITRDDGATQVTLGGWPLYRYVGDEKPGQWKGQKVAGTWFVAAPDGKKNLSCLPEGTPTPAAPPASPGGSGGGDGGGGSGGY